MEKISILSFFLGVLVSCTPNKKPIQRTQILCEKNSSLEKVSIDASIILNEKFFDRENQEDVVQNAMELTVNYISGQLYNDSWRGFKHVLGLERELIVNQKTKVSYPFDLDIDDLRTNKVEIFDTYTLNAIKKGFTKKTDQGLKVDFTAILTVASCAKEADKKRINKIFSHNFYIPRDPYLFYWSIPSKQRVEKNWNDISKAVVNPCSTSELADYNSPEYYWYFWTPETKMGSKSCKDYLLNGQYVQTVKLTKIDSYPVKTGFKMPKTQVKKISIIFGHQDHYKKPKDLKKFASYLEKKSVPKNYKDLLTNDEVSFFLFMHEMHEIFDTKVMNFETKPDHIIVNLNTDKIEFNIFFGPTDVFDPSLKPKHWSFFQNALADSEMIVYWGHSGLGENLKIDNISKYAAVRTPIEERKITTKEFVYVGCYTYSYFGEKLKQMLSGSNRYMTSTGAALSDGYRILPSYFRMRFLDQNTGQSQLTSDDFFITEQL